MLELNVLPQSAHMIATGLVQIAKDQMSSQRVAISIETGLPSISINTEISGKNPEANVTVKEFLETVATRPEILCTSAFLRNHQQDRPLFELKYIGSEGKSFFSIERVDDKAFAIALFDNLRKQFNITTRNAVLGASFPPEMAEVIRFGAESVAGLEAQVSRLGTFLTQMIQKDSEAVRALTVHLENQFQKKQNEADERIRMQQEQIDAERREFEKEKAAFDDRNRTHVRRDLLKKIQTNIEDRGKVAPVTSSASRSRLLIHGVSGLLILLSAASAVIAGIGLYRDAGHTPFDWRMVPPFSAAAIFFAVILVFYLRWTSRWADRLAHQDIAVAQYASDILRASWIAELLFEFKDEQQKELPREVLASLTEGLFKRDAFRPDHYHVADDMAEAVHHVKSFKAGKDGVKIVTRK